MECTRDSQHGYSSGSSSDTERSFNDRGPPVEESSLPAPNSLENLLGHTPFSIPVPKYPVHVFSYPVIDMRKAHRLGSPQFLKFNVKSLQKDELKLKVSSLFNAKLSQIYITEEEGRREEVLLKTVILILPETVGEKCYNLIIEIYESLEMSHSHILCARLPVDWKVSEARKLVLEELGWRGLVFCKNGNVLEDTLLLKSCGFENLEKIQALQQSNRKIELVYQPRSNVLSSYYLDVDMTRSVEHVKRQFETHFLDEIQKRKCIEQSTIHFCFRNRLLEDKQCIGLILRRNIKDEKISIYFGSKNSMVVDLKFRDGRKTRHKLLIVATEISTKSLREEVSKHLDVNPKAVKLIFEEKLIDEHENLAKVYKEKWCSGCRIVAGVKKCKTLRIRHPKENKEVPFEMYMLEPVAVLKQKIAERWGLDLLQILLFCRGFQMENRQPLLHYPIKNNMEITLQLLEHRIVIGIIVVDQKKKITLIVDNHCTTTVDDLLRFCAHHFSYPQQCSRCIFKDKCVQRKNTLAELGVKSGDKVIITYFEQALLQGSLINVFMVDERGHTVKRIGAVSSGLLLHAPKTAEVPQGEETGLDNGPIPVGIRVCNNEDLYGPSETDYATKSHDKSTASSVGKPVSVKQCLKRKKEFLRRAIAVIQRLKSDQVKGRELHELDEKVSFYIAGDDSDTENTIRDLKNQELSLDEETGRKTVAVGRDGCVNEEVSKTLVKTGPEGLNHQRENFEICEGNDDVRDMCIDYVRGETEPDCPSRNEMCISQRDKCIEDCCQKILEGSNKMKQNGPKYQPKYQHHNRAYNQTGQSKPGTVHFSQSNPENSNRNVTFAQIIEQRDTVNHNMAVQDKSFHKETSFDVINDLSGCEAETSGCESEKYTPNIPVQTREIGIETDSSDIEHITSRHGEDCQCKKCRVMQCPFLQLINGHGVQHRKPRSHTVSESAVPVTQLCHNVGYLPYNLTYPALDVVRYMQPNAEIETSGVSVTLLACVANLVGRKWKQLLRQLKVDESELNAIEYQYYSHGLHELGFQALLSWKRGKGREASKEVLLRALEDIGLKSVSEQCQNIGYCTA